MYIFLYNKLLFFVAGSLNVLLKVPFLASSSFMSAIEKVNAKGNSE